MPSSALMAHLERLVACDTQNPPRAIDGDAAIFRYCSEVVGSDFRVELHDHGDGLLRGHPDAEPIRPGHHGPTDAGHGLYRLPPVRITQDRGRSGFYTLTPCFKEKPRGSRRGVFLIRAAVC